MFLLSAIVFVPAIAAMILLFFPSRTPAERDRIRTVALAGAALVAALDVVMWYGFRDQSGSFAYEETRGWLPGIGSSYHLGVDGVSMSLLLLTGALFVAAVFVSNRVREDVKGFFVLLLVLETGVNGTLASLDFFLFFLFWELQVLPLGFLLWRWAGSRRTAGAWKLLAVETVGSAFLLLAVLVLYFKAPGRSFDIAGLHNLQVPGSIAGLLFALFSIPFALRLPIVPLHGWFADAQAESAAPVALVLAGIVSRLGAYGLYRVNVGQLQATLHRVSGAVAVIAVITVVWAAVAALREDNIRRVVGYLVISHGGLLLLAVASASPTALNGGVLLMVADGLTAAMMIVLAAGIAERVNTSSIESMGGLARRMPRGAVLWLLAALAALGLPGLAGFVGELLIVVGSYPSHRLATGLAVLGTFVLAAATLWTFQRIFFGPPLESDRRIRDLGTIELGTSVGLLCLIVLMGVLPAILMDSINFSVLTLLSGSSG